MHQEFEAGEVIRLVRHGSEGRLEAPRTTQCNIHPQVIIRAGAAVGVLDVRRTTGAPPTAWSTAATRSTVGDQRQGSHLPGPPLHRLLQLYRGFHTLSEAGSSGAPPPAQSTSTASTLPEVSPSYREQPGSLHGGIFTGPR